jgi:protein O-mannosyl-transferase
MIYDSNGYIQNQAQVFHSHSLLNVIRIIPARPLLMASFYGNYLLTGLAPAAFRITNAIVLAGTGAVLVLLCLCVFDVPGASMSATMRYKKLTALFLGLLFVVHPVQTFVVLYIIQREAILACCFYFGGLAVYVAGRSGRLSLRAAYVLCAALFFSGLCCKENVTSLPVVLLLAELTLFRQNFRDLVKRSLVIACITVLPLAAYLILTQQLHSLESVHDAGILDRLLNYYLKSGLTLVQVALTECRVVLWYAIMILAPWFHPMQLVAPQLVSTSLWTPATTLPAVLAVAVLLGIGIALVRRSPLASFGILFFFVSVAPESLLVPQYLYFGYRAILPMVGVLFLAATIIFRLERERPALLSPRIFTPILVASLMIPVVLLAYVTVSQARRWNPIQFWKAAYKHAPPYSADVELTPSRVIVTNLGAVLIDAGEYAEAMGILEQAVALDAEAPIPRLNLGMALWKSGETEKAIQVLRHVEKTYPQMPAALTLLGQALVDGGEREEGIEKLRHAVELTPRDETALVKLAGALIETDRLPEAVVNLQQALQINPASVAARVKMGVAMNKAGSFLESVRLFREVLAMSPMSPEAYQGLMLAERGLAESRRTLEELRKHAESSPGSPSAHYRLGNALMKAGNSADAIKSFEACLKLKPDFVEARANMGAALLDVGRLPEAIETLQNAVTVLTQNAELHNALGVALFRQGKISEAFQEFKKALAVDPEHAGARVNLERADRGARGGQ